MRLPSLATVAAVAVVWASSGTSASSNRTNVAMNDLLASISVKTATGPPPGMPTDAESARAAVLSGKYKSRYRGDGRDRCPSGCSSTGTDRSSWSLYNGLDRLRRACNKPMLLDFALFNQINARKSDVAIYACTADLKPSADAGPKSNNNAATCVPKEANQTETKSSVQLVRWGRSSPAHAAAVTTALNQLRAFSLVSDSEAGCNETITYAYSGKVAVGVYGGSGLANQGVLGAVLEKLSAQVARDGSVPENLLAQMCGDDVSARHTLGIAANTQGDLGAVQRRLQSWKNGTCVAVAQGSTTSSSWQSVSYLAPAATKAGPASPRLNRRADCRTIQVEAGDSCASLAAECGVSRTQFSGYNPGADFCNTLRPGQHVCCSRGTLPDFKPKPDADGYCYVHLVKTGDSCSSIGAAHDLTNKEIETFNKKTWGWNGCEKLFADYSICLSTGHPPMPAPVANAVCGPLVPDTPKVPPGTDLSLLNQCPLNACCNIWGQCGTTTDFCTPSNSSTGAPGTAAPGENGCISNCGTDIISSPAPSEQYTIAYFEAWSWQRPCLRMSVNEIDTSTYTHIHYSFIELNEDLSINIDDVADQLSLFKSLSGVKKIAALGGWAFSTEPATYKILRDAVRTPASRTKLANNIIDFLNEHGLDGIDWDWEYPSQPDIPGIPAGDDDEADNFFLLLHELKQKLPAGKTSSVTAPASYWYLRAFPIEAISLVSDYLVFMTYDLHGQWDYINKYATPGCPSYDQGQGNCLRSHVNLTETINTLSMVTKAGVPSNKVAVGVTSYGRSFKMSTPGCWTEQCTFTGPQSGAAPGPCTNTAGYISDYEISLILKKNPSAKKLWDEKSYSNIVVWDETQWVAYMDKDNKATRKALYPPLGFLGTADWAVDLQVDAGKSNGGRSSNDTLIYIHPDIWKSATQSVTAVPGATLVWPPKPLTSPTTITFPPWTTTVSYSSLTTHTTTLPDGKTTTEPWFVFESWLTVLTIPPMTKTAIDIWGVSLDKSSTKGPIILTSSVQPPPFTVSVTPVINGTISIIGATKTTTITGTPIIWGSSTYYPPKETRTLGGSTTTKGGTTLPPTVITVTPNPHPTTVPDPRTTDPELNSRTPVWTSGPRPGPTATPPCVGCGSPCIFFCNPNCPFCPPNVFPGNGGKNNDNDDDDDDDDDDGDTDTVVFNAFEDTRNAKIPTRYVDMSELNAVDAALSSRVREDFDWPKTTTTMTTKPTTTTTKEPPAPTPTADCMFWDNFFYYVFEIYNIDGWVTDGGKKLREEEDGCATLTGWDWHPADDDSYAYVFFNLDFFIKAGCVERAIVSAGGPKISCKGGGIWWGEGAEVSKPRDRLMMEGQRKKPGTKSRPRPYTKEEMREFERIYKELQPPTGNQTNHTYVPMDWGRETLTRTALAATTATTATTAA